MHAPPLFVLTPLTRGANEQRRIVIQTVELKYRTFIVLVCGFLISLPFALISYLFLSELALLVIPAVTGLIFLFVEGRSSKGLQLRHYETLIDKQKSVDGKWFMCSNEIDPVMNQWGRIVSNTVPVDRYTPEAGIDHALTGGMFTDEATAKTRKQHPQPGRPDPAESATAGPVSKPAPVERDVWGDPIRPTPTAQATLHENDALGGLLDNLRGG